MRNGSTVLLRLKLLLAFMVLALAGHAKAGDGGIYTINKALREFHDLSLLTEPANPPRGYGQASSWDRNLANYDQGNFEREEGREMVLLDVRGPGVLTRLWTAEPMGFLQFYFDGATEPQLTMLWSELRDGKIAPLAEPFVTSRGGGCVMRFPMPFEKGLKITLTGQTWCHWQADYQYFTADTKVKTWVPGMEDGGFAEELAAATAAWNHPEAAVPAGSTTLEMQVALSPENPSQEIDLPDGALVTEVSFEQANGGVIPADFEFAYGDRSAPWRVLAGVWESKGDSNSLLQGRRGATSYFRVPFVVDQSRRISFRWRGSDKSVDVLGIVRVRTLGASGGKQWPGLMIEQSSQRIGEGKFFRMAAGNSPGRLLVVGAHVSTSQKPDYIEGDNTAFVDGEAVPSLRGTGFEDFFDSAWYFEKGKFATAVAGSPVQENGLRVCAARAALWPLGLPFRKGIQLDWEAGAQNEAPESTHDIVMIGQAFPNQASPDAVERIATTDLRKVGAREIKANGLGYVQFVPPISAESNPKELWLDVNDAAASGTLSVDVAVEGLRKVSASLDLPLGWRGTLRGANEQKEVFDIGWPPIDLWQPAKGTLNFDWSAIPPASLQGGDAIVQLRVDAIMPDGAEMTLRMPVRLTMAPRGAAVVEVGASQITRDGGAFVFELPDTFAGMGGDQIVLDAQVDVFDGARDDFAKLEYEPRGGRNLGDGSLKETAPLIPEDGTAFGRARLRGVRHSLVFTVGRYISWVGSPRTIRVSMPGRSIDVMRVFGAKVYRQYQPAKAEGWSRRVPLEERTHGQFLMPHAAVTLAGNELREAIRLVVATPQDQINPEFRAAAFLENVEAGKLNWRLADKARRSDRLMELPSFVFPARRTGERIAIHDPRFVGRRFFGIQFGYDPMSAIVGVRDCEGRLAAVDSLYMNEPSTFPQFLWVALPVPSRDGWIYLEALGMPAGSYEQRISLQRVMVFDEDDPAKLFP
ncbi:DUF2961 domain-containing protein [Candidatus Sumerlaeota bacterium]|nr:DUF2961 domain-containing protein [Candidatus Sumerlaeota bacterium]